eukprot:TRINITY_DN33267_c0_g1_i1.p1 TRINITY_DN33267_c0_g1~~TRINITY_DN33267_c0_g1_i1.p1  ORF type:complete len:595 (+),score=72.50 TRINITY_DN33267_c0_g1_i1:130-1914(+)
MAESVLATPTAGGYAKQQSSLALVNEGGEAGKVLLEYMSLMPLVYNQVGEGPVDDSIAGSRVRAEGEQFQFKVGPGDALIVIDMQNDFIPRGLCNDKGGRLGAAEGDMIAKPIADLMRHFCNCGGTVVATRDYHPFDHVSFMGYGGTLPAHCIGGHFGSQLYKPIATAMEECMGKALDRTIVAFKGFHEDIDSFGGLTYDKDHAENRGEGLHDLPQRKLQSEVNSDALTGGQNLVAGEVHPSASTGCMVLKCYGMQVDGQFDANAPPDILAARSGHQRLENVLKDLGIKRIFVCGLVTDYCVLDTTCNARNLGFSEVYMVIDAARPVYAPPSDFFQAPYGSGFVQDPKAVKRKVITYDAKFCFVGDILPQHALHAPAPVEELVQEASPSKGGPVIMHSWKLHLAPSLLKHFEILELPGDSSNGTYKILRHKVLQSLKISEIGVTGPKAKISLPAEVRQDWGIPDEATHYCWCYGLEGAYIADSARFAWIVNDPSFRFLNLGGFAYFSSDGKAQALLAVGGAGDSKSSISFAEPKLPVGEVSSEMLQRCEKPRSPKFREKGVRSMGWLGNEELGCEHGGFLCEMNDGTSYVYAVK